MAKNKSSRKVADPCRRILDASVSLLTLGTVLYLTAVLFPRSPRLAPVAEGLRTSAPWPIFLGVLLLLLYLAVRRASAPPAVKTRSPITFGESTTTFHEPEIGIASKPKRR